MVYQVVNDPKELGQNLDGCTRLRLHIIQIVRRLALVLFALCFACSLYASASTPQVPASGPVKKQAVAENHQLRSMAQSRYQKATRDKAPLTASPADGESFVNEFVGPAVDDTASDETLTSSENPARMPK